MFLAQLLAVPPVSLLGGGPSDGWRHMGGWDHMGGWGVGSMLLVALLLLAVVGAVVAAVVALTRSPRSDGPPRADGTGLEDRARQILAERYARGEIGTEEYRDRLHELR